MDIAYLSIIIFTIITIIFCLFFKVPINLPGNSEISIEEYSNIYSGVYSQNLIRLGLYFVITIVIQFILNTIYIVNKCGGSASNNVGAAAVITFFPWVFIFGIVIIVLLMFPGFKTPFTNVVGYFAIASSANQIMTNIFDTDANIEDAINKEGLTDEMKVNRKKSAELILKICGNKSLIMNQMSPENFLSVWNGMKSLMKQGMGDFSKERQDLLNLVVMKDSIGDMMWYIYTAVLLSSIVSFKLASRGCVKSIDQLKASHDEFLQQEAEAKKQQELNNSQPVILT